MGVIERETETKAEIARLRGSRTVLGILFFFCCGTLLFSLVWSIAVYNSRDRFLPAEVLEIKPYEIPGGYILAGIKIKDIETGEESQHIFHLQQDSNKVLKKGGIYLLIYNIDVKMQLRGFGVNRNLTRAYELR